MTATWFDANQQIMAGELSRVRAILENFAGRGTDGDARGESNPLEHPGRSPADEDAPVYSTLDRLTRAFRLSHFERDLLILCAGIEFDSRFPSLCSLAHGDPLLTYPTFSLALACLPEAHWSALSPDAPLRKWRMIEIGAGHSLTQSPLRIDERVLHYLAGVNYLDERVRTIVDLVTASDPLVPSHQEVAQRVVDLWRNCSSSALPVIQLQGGEYLEPRSIAAEACDSFGLTLYSIWADSVLAGQDDGESLIRLLERESILGGCAMLLECNDSDAPSSARTRAIGRLVERLDAPLFVSSSGIFADLKRSTVALTIPDIGRMERRDELQGVLGDAALRLNGHVERISSQFNLESRSISAAKAVVAGNLDRIPDDQLGSQLWDAVRASSRHRLDELAQRVEPTATWGDLILPESATRTLRDVAVHVRHRATVYDTWGFGAKSNRGLGISALFSGASGTGKTMAAEVLANELRLDLYRIDLSSVVSKYIGETEKNLRRVFDAAEGGGAILLFDEADALFGKRSEVKDSHDRYANIEVSYLLQRMEAYRGLAILTTNLRSALDTAFLRRIRFIVQFPFPDIEQRARIWSQIFPLDTPTRNLDVDKLARLNVAGGTIRNIALSAAFVAAEAGEPVQMHHLLRAARTEYAKLEKSLTDAETGGWL